jgi:hypothetical protein
VTTLWWIVVIGVVTVFAFSAGFVAHAEWVLWLRVREPYVREIDLTLPTRRP